MSTLWEERVWFNIIISDEEQKKINIYYEENENKSEFALLLAPPPLFVETEFRCPCCGEVFVAKVGIYRENDLDYRSEKIVLWGERQFFEKNAVYSDNCSKRRLLIWKRESNIQKNADTKEHDEKFEPTVKDPFFSEENIRYLEKIVRDIQDGKAHFTEHDLLELDE